MNQIVLIELIEKFVNYYKIAKVQKVKFDQV